MASKRTDSNVYTIIFAIIMVVVVGALLAFVATVLKPTITENQRIEKQQSILYALGVNNNDSPNSIVFIPATEASDAFKKYIVKQYIIQGNEITENDEAYLIELATEENLAKKPNYQKRLPVFVGEKDGKTLYIIPMRGKGLWDAIWGFMSLDENFIVQGVFFDHAGETPGLGSNIQERYFMDDYIGEHIFDKDGNLVGIASVKGNNDPLNLRKEDNKVDALAGATITVGGVTAMIRKYLREYVPHLEKIINESK